MKNFIYLELTLILSILSPTTVLPQTGAVTDTSAVMDYSLSIADKIQIHDPSEMQYENGYYMIFCTGKGIHTWTCEEKTGVWKQGDTFFAGEDKPVWWDKVFPTNKGMFWGPSVPSKWVIYYSFEADEDYAAAIGRAVATGTAPNLKWRDDGPVLLSPACRDKNKWCPVAMDQSVFSDDKGNLFMSFGSGTSGIWIVELDKTTGHLSKKAAEGWSLNNPAFHHVAFKNTRPEDRPIGSDDYIEASYVYRHPDNGYYYLFVNWGWCCRGVRSTYSIRVGRSKSPTGPFLDKTGKDMVNEGGSKVIQSQGRYIGPGHAGIYRHTDGRFAFTFHYYDAEAEGLPKLAVRDLTWAENWPVVMQTSFISASGAK